MATTESTIQSTIGALVGGRCYPADNPAYEGGQTYVIYNVIFEQDLVVTQDGQTEKRIQIDVYGPTYSTVKSLSNAVKSAMDGLSGYATAMIQRFDDYEEVTREFKHTLEFYVWH